MLDGFNLALLNLVQRDDSQTADQLAERVPLSPSAIARRLRRLRALMFIELAEHADLTGKVALEERLRSVDQVQFCYETTGQHDLLAMFDCSNMAEFNSLCDELLTADSTVRRYETSFVKREVKFAPFVELKP